MSIFSFVVASFLLIWQTAAAAWDLRDQRIPVWFSLIPLVAGLIYLAVMDSPVGAVLLLVSILATHLPSRIGFILAAVPAAILVISPSFSSHLALTLGWIILWILWLLGVMGGADALAGTVLCVWFPYPLMLVTILAGLFLWSLGMLLLRHGLDAPLRVWVVIRQGWGKPSVGLKRLPGLGAFPLAMVLFLICSLLL